MGKRVGIFGGSFDPVHNGHIYIVKSFLDSGLLDEILILLTPDPPHKTRIAKAGFEDRFNMLKLAFNGMNNIRISRLEKDLPKPSYTLQTVEYLQREYPDNIWYLCMGEDSLDTFHTWHRYRDILKKVTLLVAERPGFTHPGTSPDILEKSIIVKHTPVEISSTNIRLKGHDNQFQSLPAPVADYILEHQLYQ